MQGITFRRGILFLFAAGSMAFDAGASENLTRSASVSVSASTTLSGFPAKEAIDGIVKADGSNRWNSQKDGRGNDWIEVDLGAQKSVSGFDLYLGKGGSSPNPPKGFVVKYRDAEGKLVPIEATSRSSNSETHLSFQLATPVNARKFRFVCTAPSADGYCRVEEFMIFGASKIGWGAQWQGMDTDQKIALDEAASLVYQRMSIDLPTFDGKASGLDLLSDAGIKPIVNVSWTTSSSGSKSFPETAAQLQGFKDDLKFFLGKYQPEIIVVENEPTTDAFWPGVKADPTLLSRYVNELAAAIEVVKDFNAANPGTPVKVADGALHVQALQEIKNGSKLRTDSVSYRQSYLIDQYNANPTIRDGLDYINLHWDVCTGGDMGSATSSFSPTILRDVGKWVSDQINGRSVISNEWHTECDSTDRVREVVRAVKAANIAYPFLFQGLSMMFSGDGKSGGEPFNAGTALNPLGQAYADEIKAAYP